MTIPACVTTLIFDVDQTLVDTDAAWQTALDATAWHLARVTGTGPTVIAAAYRQVSDDLWSRLGQAPGPMPAHAAMRARAWRETLDACGITLPPAEARNLPESFAAAQLDAFRPDPRLPGLLDRAATRYRVAACSNGDEPWTRAKLARAGIEAAMETVTCGITEQVRKPDPRLLARCCAVLGVPADRCLHIGDDWDNDITCATVAGLHPVWITTAASGPAPPPAAAWAPSATAFLSAFLSQGDA